MKIKEMTHQARLKWTHVFLSNGLRQYIKKHKKFTYTDLHNIAIYKKLTETFRDDMEKLEIVYFKPSWWRLAFGRNRIRAYTYPRWRPNRIYLNSMYPGRTVDKIAGTLAHEYCHLKGLHHGGNRPHGPKYDNAVPLQIGKYVNTFKWVR
jgi:hypothetical protein